MELGWVSGVADPGRDLYEATREAEVGGAVKVEEEADDVAPWRDAAGSGDADGSGVLGWVCSREMDGSVEMLAGVPACQPAVCRRTQLFFSMSSCPVRRQLAA